MPPAVMATRAATATATAPRANQRRDLAGTWPLPPALAAVSGVDGDGIADQYSRGDPVRRPHEFPPALDDAHAVHAASGGGWSCRSRRSSATRDRSAMSPHMRSRIAMALTRSGQWNARLTVSGVDCCWCSEFHHFTEKYTMGMST